MVDFPADTSPSAANDHGLIHQFLNACCVSSNTAHTVQQWTAGPIKVVVILVVALVLTRLESRLARRMVSGMRLGPSLRKGTPRGRARAKTLAGVVSAVLRTVIWVVAILAIFGELGLRLTPFVATATIIGAALGFGAQTLVKDFLSGLLILAEDQYGVGDNIVVGSTTGTVEGVTLRVTRIRSVDGVVWYVPNGDIRTVGNNSEGDSQALVEVVVPLGTDLVAAGRVAEEEARAMSEDPGWSPLILGPPTFAGVADVDADGVTMRVMVRTAPGVHLRVTRELRLRILEGLRRRGLAWATPATSPGDGIDPSPADAGGAAALGSTTSTTAVADRQAPAPPPTRRSSTEPPRRSRLPAWLRSRRAAPSGRERGQRTSVAESGRAALVGIDHVQLAMPEGAEAEGRADAFYAGLLGLERVAKPPALARRGGRWFERGATRRPSGGGNGLPPRPQGPPRASRGRLGRTGRASGRGRLSLAVGRRAGGRPSRLHR